jgi:hypothetical protein
MLRLVIILLVLANAVYFGWTQGHLGAIGLAPYEQTEPERLQGQIKPESLRLLNGPKADASTSNSATPGTSPPTPIAEPAPEPSAAPTDSAPSTDIAAASASAPAAPEVPATACWQATAFNAEQATRLRAALEATGLSRGSWRIDESRTGGRWVVYMGRFNDEQLDRKRSELNQLGVAFRTLPAPLGPGLALGTYSSEAAAELGLQDVSRKGVRTARVVQERAEAPVWNLRLPAATEAQRETVAGLGPALAGKRLQRCE